MPTATRRRAEVAVLAAAWLVAAERGLATDGRRVVDVHGAPVSIAEWASLTAARLAAEREYERDESGRFAPTGEGGGSRAASKDVSQLKAGNVVKLTGLAGKAQATGTLDAFKTIHEAARGYNEAGSVADDLDLDTVTDRQIELASRQIAERSQAALERDGYPEEFVVHRAGGERAGQDSDRGVVSVSTRASIGQTFGETTAYTVRRDDVLTYGEALQRGTFKEDELQVDMTDLARATRDFLASVAARLAEFDESKHERDSAGRFTSGGGGESTATRERERVPEVETGAHSRDPVARLAEHARTVEPVISDDMDEVVRELGGKLAGFEFRLKAQDSLERKIGDKVEEGMTREEAAATVKDALRFTMEFGDEDYTEGTVAALAEMQSRGYDVREVKNYWEPNDPYSGINAVLRAPEGITLELQFHTPESLGVKFGPNEAMYHEYRETTTPPERRLELYGTMARQWDDVTVPRAIESFGTPVFMEHA